MKFSLTQYGRQAEPIEAKSISDARAQLRYIARGELRRCKTRFRTGYLHRISPDSYAVTLAPSLQSSLWTSISLSY